MTAVCIDKLPQHAIIKEERGHMNNPECNRYRLRALLLEGENAERIVNLVKTYSCSEQTAENHRALSDSIKKEITASAKELMSDSNVDTFIQELAKQLPPSE